MISGSGFRWSERANALCRNGSTAENYKQNSPGNAEIVVFAYGTLKWTSVSTHAVAPSLGYFTIELMENCRRLENNVSRWEEEINFS